LHIILQAWFQLHIILQAWFQLHIILQAWFQLHIILQAQPVVAGQIQRHLGGLRLQETQSEGLVKKIPLQDLCRLCGRSCNGIFLRFFVFVF
jgi:hypothetical protein